MAGEKIQIQIDAETRQAIANLAKLQTATEDVEKATKKLSVSQRIIETLNTDISKLGGKVGESMRRVSMGVAGGIAAFGALAYKVTEMAAAIEQQEIAINRLGPAYEAMRSATNGVISAQEAMKAQQTLVQAGFRVSTEQLATIARAAREYSRATGTEMTQSLEQLTDALRTGSAEGLGRFGVSLQQGVTGTRAFGTALEQLTAQQEHTATSARTMREDLDKLPEGLMAIGRSIMTVLEGPANALTEWLTGLAGASTNLRGVLSELASAGDTIRQRERQEATDRANMQRLAARDTALRNLQAIGLADTGALRGLSPERIEALTRRGFQITGSLIGPQTPGSAAINVFRAGRGEASTQIERQALFQAAVEQARQEQAAEEALARLPQGPIRRTTGTRAAARAATADTQLTAAKQQLVQAQIEARQQGVELVEGSPRALEDTASYLLRLASEQRELTSLRQSEREKGEAAFAESRRGLETPQERATREREKAETAFAMIREGEARGRRESFGGRFASALGIELDEQGRVPALDAAQTGVEMLQGSLSTLTSGFNELFNTLAAGSVSAGEAFQQFASKTLSSLGQMAVNKGVFYTFEGIASLFTNPIAAPAYFAAGAGLIALGAGLGAAGAAVAPTAPPGAGAAPAAARSASGASPRDIGAGAGNVTIVLSSLVPPGPRELQGLVHAQRQAGRYGIDRDRMVPRQVRA